MGKILLGFNGNCFTNRYDEPEVWTKICKDMGIHHVMFNVDLIDPYWSWDTQKALADRTLEACDKNDVKIFSAFGGHHGHQHYMGHFDKAARREAVDFFKRAAKLTAYLGGKSFGTCFAIMTDRCNRDAALRREIIESALASYAQVAEYGAEVGLSSIAYEMTSVDRESCATFEENDYILERGRDMAIPLHVCLDMGHRNMHTTPQEASHIEWIRRYAYCADVIDCQQTDMQASRHWPFTPEYNEKGVIRGDEIVKAITDAKPDHDILLSFELRSAAFWPQDNGHLSILRASVDYWRQFVKD
ncbi:MAG TPA: TIM barrel protein [Bacillota bacterium]|nr:TIM barrel protein [Bacillota bacterium]